MTNKLRFIGYEYIRNSEYGAILSDFGTSEIIETTKVGYTTTTIRMAYDPTNSLHVDARLSYCSKIFDESRAVLREKIRDIIKDELHGKLIPLKKGFFR